MGKSNKKAKSDRINALRKQYDMFLEEDKKRKERNDFILGRLDKMRYNTALVPVRHKPSAYESRPAVVGRLGFQPEFPSDRGFQSCITNQIQLLPDIQAKNNDETFLIQEISKKYILIPKLRTKFVNHYMSNETTNQHPEKLQEIHPDQDAIKDLKPNTHDSSDWKSKYEILNILQNEEKGKPIENIKTSYVTMEQSVPKEVYLRNNQDEVTIDYDNYVNTNVLGGTPKEYVNEVPEKDLAEDTIHYDLSEDSKYSPNNKVSASVNSFANEAENVTISENNNIVFENVDQADAIGDQLQNITLNYEHSNAPNIGILEQVTNYDEPQPEPEVNMTPMIAEVGLKHSVNEENVNVHDEYPVEAGFPMQSQNIAVEQHDPAEGSEQVVYLDNTEKSQMQDLNYNLQPTADPNVNNDIYEEENVAKVSNGQEFGPNIGVQLRTDNIASPGEHTYINSNTDTVEQENLVYEQSENPVNVNESIEDYDAEQREMFYTEQTDENYIPQQGDEVNTLQFSQNEYPQNQEYAYYENTEPEAYPVELNDHEVTEAYDPHYEQQYVELDQGQEQQQYVEQQQYQEPDMGTNQVHPEFENLQYEQQFESQEQIEKTLDVEDDYTAQIPPNLEPADMPDNATLPAV